MWTSILHIREINFSEWLPFQFMLGISFVMQCNDLLLLMSLLLLLLLT